MSKENTRYDLNRRTQIFSEKLIEFIKKLKITLLNKNTISQVLRSGTSIGANYTEADGAGSKKDFEHKISICRKESKELSLIFSAILNKSKP